MKVPWIDKYWYIISYKDFMNPRVFPVYFISKKAALIGLNKQIPNRKRTYYDVIRGSRLKEMDLIYVNRLGRVGKATKYDYTKDMTNQFKKNIRTMSRRRLRRMGMLTKIKPRYDIRKKPPVIKQVINTQIRGNAPYTIARVFRLQRKPNHYYYIILDKKVGKRKGILFTIDSLRVDIKRKTITKVIINIQRKDLITPYLITELIKIYGREREILYRCRKEGLRFNYWSQAAILTRMRKDRSVA